MNLNTKEWKEFTFGRLIDSIYKAHAYTKEDLAEVSSLSENAVRYITRTGENNGCEMLVSKKGLLHIEDGNAISIGDTTATCFYQSEPFITGDHMIVIRASWFNEILGIYICTLLNNEQYKYSYGRAFLMERVKNTLLRLPVKRNTNGTPYFDDTFHFSDEGFVPDWQFIENYMKSLHYKPITTSNKIGQTPNLNTDSWKQFQLKNILTINRGQALTSQDKEEYAGTIPCVNGTIENNGVFCYLNKDIESKGFKLVNSPALSLVRVGNGGITRIQTEDFYVADNAFSVHLLFKENIYTLIFMSSILNKESFKYSYGRTITQEKYLSTIIKLPIRHNANGTPYINQNYKYSDEGYVPDWQFMENYIKSLPYGDRLILS